MLPAFYVITLPPVLALQEFHPYVFQVFALLIELHTPPLPATYLQILPGLLTPVFWERPGNIPALTRLLEVGRRFQKQTHKLRLLCIAA